MVRIRVEREKNKSTKITMDVVGDNKIILVGKYSILR